VWLPDKTPFAPLEIRSHEHFTDVDGTDCDAYELMSPPRYGRVKTERGWVEMDGAEAELLAPGSGFHVERAGTTGQPVGRPAKGIQQPKRIAERMSRVAREDADTFEAYVYYAFDFHDPNGKPKKRQLAHLQHLWSAAAKDAGINVDALSRLSGIAKRTINRWIEKGHAKVAQNSPVVEGENEEMTQAELAADIRRIKDDVRAIRSLTEHEAAMMPLRFQKLHDLTVSELPDDLLDQVADPNDRSTPDGK
jgi:hypothetical protein